MRPTFRNLTESFEGWAYRNGFLRELAELERAQFLERKAGKERLYRLTVKGRLRALGGCDPLVEWNRVWDGRWRLVCFDVPVAKNKHRQKLRRYLRNQRFGYLQNSLWITPDPVTAKVAMPGPSKNQVETLVVFEATACGGESDMDVIHGAWDFARINQLYTRYLQILDAKPFGKRAGSTALALRTWAEAERSAWRAALKADPLLPRTLLPKGYLGQRAWQRRIEVLRHARGELDRLRM